MKKIVLFVLTFLIAMQLHAQEYEYKFEVKKLCERTMTVHSRTFSWNPLDHTDNKNTFEFFVPVNTVEVIYSYCSIFGADKQVPALKLMSGVTQCVGSVASYANKGLGAGLSKISEGLDGLAYPTGNADVDIFISDDASWIKKFREASTDDCQKFYDSRIDLLSQKSGYKVFKFNEPSKNGFTLYLGLLNKDYDDAITVRVEVVAITATKIPIAKPDYPTVNWHH